VGVGAGQGERGVNNQEDEGRMRGTGRLSAMVVKGYHKTCGGHGCQNREKDVLAGGDEEWREKKHGRFEGAVGVQHGGREGFATSGQEGDKGGA